LTTDPFETGGILEVGNSWLIVAPRRSGKTALCVLFMMAAVQHDWIAVSNVLFIRWNSTLKKWVRAQPEGTYYAESWADYVALLPMALRNNKKILLSITEAGSSDLAGGTTTLQVNVRAALAVTAILGKWHSSNLYDVQSLRLINAALRTAGELITGTIIKRAYGSYNRREIAIFKAPDWEADPSGRTMREAVRKVELSGWATPKSELEIRDENNEIIGYDPNQIIFESESPAVWGLGSFPHSTRQFDLMGLIRATAGVPIDDQADVIENFLKNPPAKNAPLPLLLADEDEEQADEEVEDETSEGGPKGDKIKALYELFDQGVPPSEAVRTLGVAKSWVYREFKRWNDGKRPRTGTDQPSSSDTGTAPQAPTPKRRKGRRPRGTNDNNTEEDPTVPWADEDGQEGV
jgi:Homeodomain-like domain-containing protein